VEWLAVSESTMRFRANNKKQLAGTVGSTTIAPSCFA